MRDAAKHAHDAAVGAQRFTTEALFSAVPDFVVETGTTEVAGAIVARQAHGAAAESKVSVHSLVHVGVFRVGCDLTFLSVRWRESADHDKTTASPRTNK